MAAINPIRYRGYYYDVETELYYLQTRYYDPTVGRFLNADRTFDENYELIGYNLFTYVRNTPVNATDPTGQMIQWDYKRRIEIFVPFKVVFTVFNAGCPVCTEQ